VSPVRALLVDLVGTLVTVRGSVGAQYATVAARFGIEADATALDAAFKTAIRARHPIAYAPGPLEEAARIERIWWRALVGDVFERAGTRGLPRGAFEAFFGELFTHFGTAGAWEVFPDVYPAIDRLRRRGLAFGLVTNFDLRVFPLLETTGLRPVFTAVAIPASTAAAKPDPRLFLAALRDLGVRPDEAAHVGDSMEHDVRAANGLGLTGIWLDRRGRPTPAGVLRVTSLEQLAGLDCLRGPASAAL